MWGMEVVVGLNRWYILLWTNRGRGWERPILAFGPTVFFDANHTEADQPILGIKELNPRLGVNDAAVPRDIVWPSRKYGRRFHVGRLREKILQQTPSMLTKAERSRKELLPIGSENLLFRTDKKKILKILKG